MRAYKFRVYPTPKQSEILSNTLLCCQRLYNVALEQRKEAYRIAQKSVSYKKQQNELPKLKENFPDYANIHSQVLQNVLCRVDLAFKGFFRREAGFPRYKSKDRYDSFCYPQSGFAIKNGRVEFSKIGLVKVKFHRAIPVGSKIKTCTVKREGTKWFVIFACDVPVIHKEKVAVKNAIGIDLGLTDFAVLSNGTKIKNPKYLKQSEAKLKELQSKYSKGKSKLVRRKLTNLHRKVANQRKDFQHKLSHSLVNTFDLIAYEDLKVKQTTQRCSGCDSIVPKSLYERSHKCPHCGYESTRDCNAALNIEKLGISLVDESVCIPFVHPYLLSEAPLQG